MKTHTDHTTLPPVTATLFLAIAASVCAMHTAAWAKTIGSPPTTEPSLRYTVQPKDTLIKFSRELLVSPNGWAEVAAFNGLKDANRISPGQTIDVPLRLLKFRADGARVISTSGEVSVAAGSNLAEGAQIKVGPNSSAVIELADKSIVKVLPGTLAELLKNRSYASRDADKSIASTWYAGAVRVIQGQLEVLASKTNRRAEDLQVRLPTAVVGVRGTVFRAGHIGTNSQTEVLEGIVQGDNPAQKSGASLAAGFGAVIDPKVRAVTAVALLPAPDLRGTITQLNKPGAEFTFAVIPGAIGYRIQVARDAQFNDLVQDSNSNRPSASLGSLAEGNWYLRARGVDRIGLEGFDGQTRVAVVAVVAPRAVAPVAPVPPAPDSLFTWLAAEVVPKMRAVHLNGETQLVMPASDAWLATLSVQLASERSFAQPTKTIQALGGRFALGTLAAGEHFVRFTANDATRQASFSGEYRLSVDANWGQSVSDMIAPLVRAN